jgi:hypothetical protein
MASAAGATTTFPEQEGVELRQCGSSLAFLVMAGLVPTIHVLPGFAEAKTWIPGTRQGLVSISRIEHWDAKVALLRRLRHRLRAPPHDYKNGDGSLHGRRKRTA